MDASFIFLINVITSCRGWIWTAVTYDLCIPKTFANNRSKLIQKLRKFLQAAGLDNVIYSKGRTKSFLSMMENYLKTEEGLILIKISNFYVVINLYFVDGP